MRYSNDDGIALLTTLLVMTLMSALLIGFTTIVTSDQRYRFIDHDRVQAFYAASGGIEKLTADLGNLFLKNVAPTNAQISDLTDSDQVPTLDDVSYTATSAPQAVASSDLSTYHCNNSDGKSRSVRTVGANGYTISFCADSAGNPTITADPTVIVSGPYAGLIGLKTPYQLDVTAKRSTGGEVHLTRSIEAVAIPVFQFGIYSDVDLAFNAADDFSFGGRVHTNGNLFLAQGAGSTLTMSDKVTAVGQVVRQELSNGMSIDSASDTGTVRIAKGGGAYTTMNRTWGSVEDGPDSSWNEPTWTSVSLSTYKGYIKNGRTGAKRLNLPLITVGGTNTDVVRRALAGEDSESILFKERAFGAASLRVLLSDKVDDITGLPTIDTTVAPTSLEAGGTFGGIPIATSPGPLPVTPNISNTVSAGSNKSMTITGNTPSYFKIPDPVTVTSGANQWSVTACTGKTSTTFTGCTVTRTAGSGSIPGGATVQAAVAGVGTVSTTTTGTTATGTGKTLSVTTTMGFAPNTFWVDDQVITCGGYSSTQLTACAVASSISANTTITDFALTPAGTSVIGGYIKIERKNASDDTWHDVTAEILGYGIGAPSENGSCSATDPSPNAIIRLQRLADDAWAAPCIPTLRGGPVATDYWPDTLFDTREAWPRETAPAGGKIKLGGVMQYVAIDAANLSKWFAGAAPFNAGTGNLSKPDNGGYSIYISDRRNNRDSNSDETAEYGWEDFVNPTTASPNGELDTGEDVNGNNTLETYGGVPNCNGQYNALSSGGITCVNAFYNTAFRPTSDLATGGESFNGVGRATVNRAIIFRRAVKLINGSSLAAWVSGLTVVTENPVYVQGNWNANGTFSGAHAATAVIADALTVLSGNWQDSLSFASPYNASGRSQRTANSYYRMAILAGKGPIFPHPSGTGATFGTDGGAHGFIRFLEDNGSSPDTIHYKGSLATFYYNRQGVGVFKGNNGFVYGIPAVRDYTFDTDFLTPSLLPPLTPMFRDMNATGFSQELRPGK